MRALVTGASGTVGQALMRALVEGGHGAAAWDRGRVSITDYWAMEAYVREQRPDVLFHLAIASRPTGEPDEAWRVGWHWPSELGWITRSLGIRLVFASTVLVWSARTPGPLRVDTPTDAQDDYGGGKARAEERVRSQDPSARIARLGWQIGSAPGGNQMLQYLTERAEQDGVVRASRRWLPSCSRVEDAAAALIAIADKDPGTYLVNSNRDLTFFDIATALSARHGGRWRIEPSDEPAGDQRMLDERVAMPDLRAQLGAG